MFFSGNVANGRSVLPSHNDSLVLKSGQESKFGIIYEISRQTNKCPTWSIYFRSPSIYLILAYRKKLLHDRSNMLFAFWILTETFDFTRLKVTSQFTSLDNYIHDRSQTCTNSDPSGSAQSRATVGTGVASALSHCSPKADLLDLEVCYCSN